MDFITEDIIRVVVALFAGAVLGFERELHDKPAGFRTLALICLGSAVFTIISEEFFHQDRVASNIVTGIGFLGAGVMMREGLSVKGITTASTIWVTAAIGMTIGVGAYLLAAVELILVLATLIILNRFERGLQAIIQKRSYEVTFKPDVRHQMQVLEEDLIRMGVTFSRSQVKKNANRMIVTYRVTAGRKLHGDISRLLAENDSVEGFEV